MFKTTQNLLQLHDVIRVIGMHISWEYKVLLNGDRWSHITQSLRKTRWILKNRQWGIARIFTYDITFPCEISSIVVENGSFIGNLMRIGRPVYVARKAKITRSWFKVGKFREPFSLISLVHDTVLSWRNWIMSTGILRLFKYFKFNHLVAFGRNFILEELFTASVMEGNASIRVLLTQWLLAIQFLLFKCKGLIFSSTKLEF